MFVGLFLVRLICQITPTYFKGWFTQTLKLPHSSLLVSSRACSGFIFPGFEISVSIPVQRRWCAQLWKISNMSLQKKDVTNNKLPTVFIGTIFFRGRSSMTACTGVAEENVRHGYLKTWQTKPKSAWLNSKWRVQTCFFL